MSEDELGDLAGRVSQVPWDELIETSDYISLHVPLTEDTTHLIDAEVLRRMKPTAVLVNMVPDDHAKASGTNSTLREIGVALGIAVLTAVFTGAGGQLTPTGYVDAAVPAVSVGAGALALAAVIALFLPAGRSRGLRDTAPLTPEPALVSAAP